MKTGQDLHQLIKDSGFTIGRVGAAIKRSPASLHKDFKEKTIKKELYDKVVQAIKSMPAELKGRKKRKVSRKVTVLKKPVRATAKAAKKAPVAATEATVAMPKKRGRKPGSKNKPKVDTFVAPDGKNYRELYFEQLEINNKLIRRLMNL